VFPLKDNIPTDRTPVVTLALIAVNVIAYLVLQEGRLGLPETQAGVQWPVDEYAARPCSFVGECELPPGHQPAAVTLFTSMFMHGSILHLGGNMLFLWVFGNNIEDTLGRVRFILFYLGGGVAAMALQTAIDTGNAVPTLGASGAVSAVIGGYILLHPHARVVTLLIIVFFVTIIQLPAFVVLGLWFVQQVAFGYFDLVNAGGEAGGVAYFAHIGGFVFGLAMIKALVKARGEGVVAAR
jgi:membrane associated rhomboid family serine protease